MKKYFIANNEEQTGPFNLEELKDKVFTQNTMVWYEGLSEWQYATEVDELKDLIPNISTPPPIPKKKAKKANKATKKKKTDKATTKEKVDKIANTKTSSINSANQPAQATVKTRKSKSRFLFPFIMFVLIGLAVTFFIDQNSGSGYHAPPSNKRTYREKVVSVADIEKANPVNFLSADGTYRENFMGGKLKVNGTITNKATVATYKDAVVKVTYYSKSKTNLGSENYTIWDVFPPRRTKNFKLTIKNYSNVNTIGWEVVRAQNY